MRLPNPGESDVFECSAELGGCGGTFWAYEKFAEHDCSSSGKPALSVLVAHRLMVNGQVASCKCGAWDCRTNEVVEVDILTTLQKQYSLHSKRPSAFEID